MRRLELPPVWLLGFILLALLLARLEPAAWTLGGWATALGLVLLLAGAAAILGAVLTMRRHRTAIMPRWTASRLVTDGVFAWSRNPIYLGFAAILAGMALLFGSAPALLLVPAYALLIDRRFIRGEEAGLREHFGPALGSYRAATRRWL